MQVTALENKLNWFSKFITIKHFEVFEVLDLIQMKRNKILELHQTQNQINNLW